MHDLVLEHLGIGMVEARVDQVGAFAFGDFRATRRDVEGTLGCFGARKNVGRAAKNRRAGGADRKRGIIALGQNLCGRSQWLVIAAVAWSHGGGSSYSLLAH